jgi:hypothetical protein
VKYREIKKSHINFFSNPLGWLSLFVGLVGLLSSYYFYRVSRKIPDLRAHISKEIIVFARVESNPRLKIYWENKEVKSNILTRNVYIWNAGNKSIKPENILSPISLIAKGVEILDASIVKQNRPNIINAQIISDPCDKERIQLDWDILEKNDGFIANLTYAGEAESYPEISGVIEEQRKIRCIDEFYFASSPSDYYWSVFKRLIGGPALIVIGFIFLRKAIEEILGKASLYDKIISIFISIPIIIFLYAYGISLTLDILLFRIKSPPIWL